MKVYTDSIISVNFDDLQNVSESYETYVYTNHGIYKKYKKHFFKLNINPNTKVVDKDKHTFYLDNGSVDLDKKSLLTAIPYQCYLVNMTVSTAVLDNNITLVREVDNDLYENVYFLISSEEDIKHIRLYLK